MESILEHNGVKACVVFDPDIDMFRGEILGLSGSADFYASDVASLKEEMMASLESYLEVCKENAIDPYKSYNGKIAFRTKPDIHKKLEELSISQGLSINRMLEKLVRNGLDAAHI
ncbi:type II toxin-antitoxin system HicB family antitoxin [Vibrio cholerae]|uniref:type II toxin-antitoxin system HicB family antitoxin n=1 Tax=Vibrio cholerae TaxID=666 RepID=UPI000E0A5154|nr:type II toxin-antitoxin system HicB family antitoxin [Vibrio cholerae]EGQ8122549.1 type II toxin-antitoxin system HicB family antitoxin [Vibrio cholerae]EJL6637474.1 type II toxin-antitoxin system HicB family antitoxin [Vibrio cholerae]EKO6518005.1 type II toxin-antitoxin system HicB family antitoxin [Vibrio cholerae]TXY25572.1 type II toxin-antitoxin system HicB family antitoxin [Vibrio cholerae]